ncbi:sigma-70 family RNA polymerase sigma factor [Microcoleus sp. FACHB-1515]|uniref:RNA polymerase sigma factor n=1 Tax=Cyanophyceae TaxID=3028117 RepID=UPI001681C77D|nr:sigma-70 family RNA polymerase sigma factor [Microcoleus sp. FACHB-1515]MBD2090130.1 sigma-70 family RNA polymerase sigma factor [Microcoleus sp. FACHB-1515]
MHNPSQHSIDDEFDSLIETLLSADSPLSYSFLSSIQAWLRQFNIASRVEASEVLHEAYLRAKAARKKGEIIRSPHAWLRRVCFNIVREQQRKLGKYQLAEVEILEDRYGRIHTDQQVSSELLDDRIQVMLDAFLILKRNNPESAELLQLKDCEGMSWLAIQAHLTASGSNAPNVDTLRQRCTRARKQLRQIYHETEKASV